MKERFSQLKPILVIAMGLVLGILYWRGATIQLTLLNTDMDAIDQSAYMNYARQMVETNYTFVGGRNRMPFYPFIQSLFYDPAMSDDAFFLQGKYVNLVLSIVLLIGIGIILNYFFDWLHVINLMLIVTFMLFIFKAGFFQSELLFYFLNFCLFLLMWRMFRKPSWLVAILTGFVAGIAHLTKASILPGLIIFLFCYGFGWLLTFIQRYRIEKRDIFSDRPFFYRLASAFLLVLIFLVVVYPYIRTSKERFGHYFYNVNSTFYFWYDSWEEAKQGTRAHGDRVGWPDMPAEDIPSLSKYLREHSLGQIFDRFIHGSVLMADNIRNSYGYFNYFAIYALTLIVVMARYSSHTRQIIRSNLTLSLFLIIYFSVYLLLYAWFSPLVFGQNRLILAQFLPIMFTISIGLKQLLSGKLVRIGSTQIDTLRLINLVILPLVIINIYVIVTDSIDSIFGGL